MHEDLMGVYPSCNLGFIRATLDLKTLSTVVLCRSIDTHWKEMHEQIFHNERKKPL